MIAFMPTESICGAWFRLGQSCITAQKRGWGGIKNGDLLRLAEGDFDLFITSDQNIQRKRFANPR